MNAGTIAHAQSVKINTVLWNPESRVSMTSQAAASVHGYPTLCGIRDIIRLTDYSFNNTADKEWQRDLLRVLVCMYTTGRFVATRDPVVDNAQRQPA
jgi:hypothetical protein